MKKIYIILSHSGTIPSIIIRKITRCDYSHVALALDEKLDKMYSFGRKKVNNPFNGGFVIEKVDGKFYQKFNKTECIIYSLEISDDSYVKLENLVNSFEQNSSIYHYDIIGLLFKAINIRVKRKNHFVCTDFISYLLAESSIYTFAHSVIKPKDFISIPNKDIVYNGLLLNYQLSNKKTSF